VVLKLAANAANDNKKTHSVLRHTQLAIRNNEESTSFDSKTITSGGFLSNIFVFFILITKRARRPNDLMCVIVNLFMSLKKQSIPIILTKPKFNTPALTLYF
jgi:hypothetical protein